MLLMTQYTPIPTCAAKFTNFAEMKHPSVTCIGYFQYSLTGIVFDHFPLNFKSKF